MPLFIVCPQGHRLKVPSKHMGKQIHCPVCQTPIAVPASGEAEGVAAPLPKPSKEPLLRPPQHRSVPQLSRQPDSMPKPDSVVQPDFAAPSLSLEEGKSAVSPADGRGDTGQRSMLSEGGLQQSTDFLESPNFDFLVDRTDLHAGSIRVVYEDPPQDEGRRMASDDRLVHGYLLASVAGLVAVVCAIPPLWEHLAVRETGGAAVDPWTYLVFLAVVLQVGGALYALRLPDWSTLWVASVIAALAAALYAMGLALTFFAARDHALVQELGLLDEVFHQRAQLWCCMAMCVLLILAYAYGRCSVHWYTTERRLSASRL